MKIAFRADCCIGTQLTISGFSTKNWSEIVTFSPCNCFSIILFWIFLSLKNFNKILSPLFIAKIMVIFKWNKNANLPVQTMCVRGKILSDLKITISGLCVSTYLTPLVLEPDSDDPGTQSGHLHQLLLLSDGILDIKY